ncbi:uncharacterized protein LOC107628052 [Arachis ipaensis]|uniref:uncharacterized protein LOC107628052 n=1 Tax=Arachis ipaensis TaxID=130454 RepID=UPI0007AEF377|nr:uncharacterized protein LOC107628052 [Arachis ipaensis]
MDSEEILLILVHRSGKIIKKSNRHGVKFTVKEPLSVFIRSTDTLSDLKKNILQKAGLCGVKLVKKVFYKISMAVVSSGVQFETFVIGSDEDMEVLFHCRRNFLEVRIHELFAKLEDRVDSSGASAPNPQSTTVGGASTSMPVVAAGCLLAASLLVLPPATRTPSLITGLVGSGELDHVEDAMREDDSDDEPDHISGIIGQSFHTKEEAVMSVKDNSIRRGVQYRVMESDHLKYVGRCKEFGNSCTWMVRAAFRQRKDAAVTVKVLQEATESTYEFRPNYRKVWKAKQNVVAQIYGDWEESYAELSRWILGMQTTMDEGLWPPYAGPTIVPDPNMRHAREGRPRSTRIRNTMNEADTSRPKRCGLCRQTGHTRMTCPQRGSAPVSRHRCH